MTSLRCRFISQTGDETFPEPRVQSSLFSLPTWKRRSEELYVSCREAVSVDMTERTSAAVQMSYVDMITYFMARQIKIQHMNKHSRSGGGKSSHLNPVIISLNFSFHCSWSHTHTRDLQETMHVCHSVSLLPVHYPYWIKILPMRTQDDPPADSVCFSVCLMLIQEASTLMWLSSNWLQDVLEQEGAVRGRQAGSNRKSDCGQKYYWLTCLLNT